MADLPRILIVDDSRIVRAALGAQLRASYEIREECDGEAAWQALVLDHSLQAVISDLQMPRLDGFGLLHRLRTSKLSHLQEMPFLLVSGEETEDEREKAKALGVSDFLAKGCGNAEILTRLDHLMALTRARRSVDAEREHRAQDERTGLFTRRYIELQLAQAISQAARNRGDVSVMVLGIDDHERVVEQLGEAAAEQVATRFAKMLSGSIRQSDSLGHFEASAYAIVTPGTVPALCASFAERVRQVVEQANVTARGRRVELTVSIGIASQSGDGAGSAKDLLDLAGGRMRQAMQAGGNKIVTGEAAKAPAPPLEIPQALQLLRAGRPAAVVAELANLGRQILPLLELLDSELGLDLPLTKIGQQLDEMNRVHNKKPGLEIG